mmetsp:Transcript_24536/g.87711  ORF Transcript_24536/g.87711 Transcript_24536/m.87711 type:complete len:260 (+) Transcript_24536:1913-2692(+)
MMRGIESPPMENVGRRNMPRSCSSSAIRSRCSLTKRLMCGRVGRFRRFSLGSVSSSSSSSSSSAGASGRVRFVATFVALVARWVNAESTDDDSEDMDTDSIAAEMAPAACAAAAGVGAGACSCTCGASSVMRRIPPAGLAWMSETRADRVSTSQPSTLRMRQFTTPYRAESTAGLLASLTRATRRSSSMAMPSGLPAVKSMICVKRSLPSNMAARGCPRAADARTDSAHARRSTPSPRRASGWFTSSTWIWALWLQERR